MGRMRVFKPGFFTLARSYMMPAVISLLMLTLILSGLSQTARSSDKQGLSILDESIRRAAVKCYAIEGAYPRDIAYIETYYGVRVDRTKYAVHYEIFASNVMPNIAVIELGEGAYE